MAIRIFVQLEEAQPPNKRVSSRRVYAIERFYYRLTARKNRCSGTCILAVENVF
jgi:hypothetical protein